MPSYRVTLDVPLPLVLFVSKLLAGHRRESGTRDGTRALTCWKQAVCALAWFRDQPDIRRLGQGSGISQATAYRYKDEAVEVLAATAPTLRQALDKTAEQGLPYLILDGTLISSDLCADKKTSRKGKEIDKWYSGKAHEPAGNVQALGAPGGVPPWVSGVLPGSTHDLTAARELVLPGDRLYLKDLRILADSGYEEAGAGVLVPVKYRAVLPPGIDLGYAVKANPMPAVVHNLSGLVDHFDVVPALEPRTALNTTMQSSRVSFAGPGDVSAELSQAVAAGVTIEVEQSATDVRLFEIGERPRIRPQVAIRVINPDFEIKGSGMRMGGGPQQFEVDAE